MAEPKPSPKCDSCDKVCESDFNEDGECWGRMNTDERIAFARAMMFEEQYQEVIDPNKSDLS